jgi:5-methylcytosine-specific restriction enzyme B
VAAVDLFDEMRAQNRHRARPLAARMRPRTLDEFVGQEHFLGPGKLLRRMLLADRLSSLVFYGPPGTGKTFVAKRLAEHLAGVDDVRLVQFHPSYSYEDFFEGFRPRVSAEGQLGFELVSGPFRRLVDAARDDPAHPHVLVIDEINRGNLAKVFGELYFLLEYRDEPIELLYSPEDSDFRLPENVFLIGTMNTADRSIALVDAAMRRRFAFQAFFPGRYPIRDLLRAWLRREGLSTRPADLLDELNTRIADEDFAIGPSYLMTRRVDAEAGLERIWRTAILPLLEEHYFGQGRDLDKEFGLAALSRAVEAASGELAGPP